MSLWEQDGSGVGDTVTAGSDNGNYNLGTYNTAHIIVSIATQCSNGTSNSITMINMIILNMLRIHEIGMLIILNIINKS